jgi:hypothetical protein
MAKAKLGGAEVTCDKFVKALIDRLLGNEKRIELLTTEINDLRDQMAEQAAWLVAGKGLRFSNVLDADSDLPNSHTVFVPIELCKFGGETES